MKTMTLVTGNSGKLREYEALLPRDSGIEFTNHKLDLPEIQELDGKILLKDKLQRAYEVIKGPVIVEDVATGLNEMNGLPGPFYKFFEQELGNRALLILANEEEPKATIVCTTGYFDGETILYGTGELRGRVVEPRGENGFGFDAVIVPDGANRTLAEMTVAEKNAISHRALAARNLIEQILELPQYTA